MSYASYLKFCSMYCANLLNGFEICKYDAKGSFNNASIAAKRNDPFASLCELAWSEPGNFPEQARKMLGVVKPQQVGGLVDVVPVHQKVLALLYHK